MARHPYPFHAFRSESAAVLSAPTPEALAKARRALARKRRPILSFFLLWR